MMEGPYERKCNLRRFWKNTQPYVLHLCELKWTCKRFAVQFHNFTARPVLFGLTHFLCSNSPTRAQASSFLRFLDYTQLDTHTHTNTHPVGLLCTIDEPVTQTATYTTPNMHNRRTTVPSTGFEHAIPSIKGPMAYDIPGYVLLWYWDDQIKGEMGRIRSMYVREQKHCWTFVYDNSSRG